MTEVLYEIVRLDYKIDNMQAFSAIKHYTEAAPPELAGRYGCPTCGRTVAREDLIFTWRGIGCPGCQKRAAKNPALDNA